MANYEVRKNKLNDFQYIVFEAIASGRYVFESPFYKKGEKAYFKAMQYSDNEVALFCNVSQFDTLKRPLKQMNFAGELQLLKRIEVDRKLSFDELYDLAVKYV